MRCAPPRGPLRPSDGVEDLAIEAEDLVAGIGPEGAIGRQVERVNLRTARQPFGRPHQAKAGSIIAVQAAFGPGPDIAGSGLGPTTGSPYSGALRPPHNGGNCTAGQQQNHAASESAQRTHRNYDADTSRAPTQTLMAGVRGIRAGPAADCERSALRFQHSITPRQAESQLTRAYSCSCWSRRPSHGVLR